MILYALDTRWNFGQITEWEVVKETPKTYLVKRNDGDVLTRTSNTVRKETMNIYDLVYFHTREEAVEGYRQRLVARIEAGKATIEREKERIADYQERLRKLEANDERP